jgi:hypothetical protein
MSMGNFHPLLHPSAQHGAAREHKKLHPVMLERYPFGNKDVFLIYQ